MASIILKRWLNFVGNVSFETKLSSEFWSQKRKNGFQCLLLTALKPFATPPGWLHLWVLGSDEPDGCDKALRRCRSRWGCGMGWNPPGSPPPEARLGWAPRSSPRRRSPGGCTPRPAPRSPEGARTPPAATFWREKPNPDGKNAPKSRLRARNSPKHLRKPPGDLRERKNFAGRGWMRRPAR